MSLIPIFYDTETTGLDPKNDRIIEIAAYNPLNDTSFSSLVNPKMKLSQTTIELCKITDEMVANEKSFDIVGQKFIDFCPSNSVLIAHNNDNFDKHFLDNEFNRENLTFPNWQFLDTLKWARKYRPDLPKHSLQYLRQIYNIEENQAHRALDDVIVLYKVYKRLTDDLPIETVLELLNAKKRLNVDVMPFGKHQGKKLEDVPKSYIKWLHKNSAFDDERNKGLKDSLEKLGLLND